MGELPSLIRATWEAEGDEVSSRRRESDTQRLLYMTDQLSVTGFSR